jgi:hypothetical protein
MKKAILFLSIICASGLTIVSIYNTVVDAKSWGADIPASIQNRERITISTLTQGAFTPSRDLLT